MADSLAAALAELQTQLPKISKGQTANVRSDKGSYSYTYADLADITEELLPIMGKLGLSFLAKPTHIDGRFVLAYSLLHASGQREDGTYPLPATGTPQQVGSAISYGRRYCLCAITGVAPEGADDDGAAAEKAARERPTPKEQAQPDPRDRKMRQMFAMLKQAGKAEKQDALDYVATVIGHDIGSRNELTLQELVQVIDALKQLLEADIPVAPPFSKDDEG